MAICRLSSNKIGAVCALYWQYVESRLSLNFQPNCATVDINYFRRLLIHVVYQFHYVNEQATVVGVMCQTPRASQLHDSSQEV